MALTFSIVTRTLHPEGGKRMNVVDITFDSSYPTGGEAVTPNQLGLNTIDRVLPFPGYAASNPAGAVVPVWDQANKKILIFQSKDPGDTGGADIGLVQVADTGNLSNLTITVLAIGA